jgi:hypothetical protein
MQVHYIGYKAFTPVITKIPVVSIKRHVLCWKPTDILKKYAFSIILVEE